MNSTLAQSLTAQFYAWERWGRGWATFPFRVVLEPPFRPFMWYLPAPDSDSDDGRRTAST